MRGNDAIGHLELLTLRLATWLEQSRDETRLGEQLPGLVCPVLTEGGGGRSVRASTTPGNKVKLNLVLLSQSP